MEVTEAPSVHRERCLFASSIIDLYILVPDKTFLELFVLDKIGLNL